MDYAQAFVTLGSTVVGGAISAAVAFIAINKSSENQRSLEQTKTQLQRTLELERFDRETAAQRRVVRRLLRSLFDYSRCSTEVATLLEDWNKGNDDLMAALRQGGFERAFSDELYETLCRVADKSEYTHRVLRMKIMWEDAMFVSTCIDDYHTELEKAFLLLDDPQDAADVRSAREQGYGGIKVWEFFKEGLDGSFTTGAQFTMPDD